MSVSEGELSSVEKLALNACAQSLKMGPCALRGERLDFSKGHVAKREGQFGIIGLTLRLIFNLVKNISVS